MCVYLSERPVQKCRLKSVGPLKQSTMREIQFSIPRVSVAFALEMEILLEQRMACSLLSCACFQQLFCSREPFLVYLRH